MKLSHIHGVIKAHTSQFNSERERWDRHQRWYEGEYWDDEEHVRSDAHRPDGGSYTDDLLRLETNYPYAYIDSMTANVCPSNPMITITARDPDKEEVAQAREDLVNDTIRMNKLHEKSQDVVIDASICGFAVTKTVFYKPYGRPRTYVIDPRHFIWDRAREWEDAQYCAEATVMTKEQFEAKILSAEEADLVALRDEYLANEEPVPPELEDIREGYHPKFAKKAVYNSYPDWMARNQVKPGRSRKSNEVYDQWVVVWEFYNFEDSRYYHFLEDVEEPLYEGGLPFEFMRNPFDLIVFNRNRQDSAGISDIKLISNPQKRLNEIDTLELLHAQSTIPGLKVDVGKLANPDEHAAALEYDNAPGSIHMVELGNQQYSLQDVYMWTQTPTIGPSWENMRERTSYQIEFILGMPPYTRGSMGHADLATEAALTDTANRTRNGRKIKRLMDWVVSVGKKYLALWAEYLTPERGLYLRSPNMQHAEARFQTDFDFVGVGDFNDEWAYEYGAAAHSPTENHRLTQLQSIQQFMPTIMNLIQLGQVDAQKFTSKFLRLLEMEDVKADQAPPISNLQPPTQGSGSPGSPGIPGVGSQPGVSGSPELPGPGGNMPGSLEDSVQAMMGQNPNPNADLPRSE